MPKQSDFSTLSTAYNSNSVDLLDSSGPNFVLAGYYGSNTAYFQGSDGGYWSSTAYGSSFAYGLYLTSSSVKYSGFSVRCVARETMQTVDQWGESVEEGQSVTAVDERDGNTYTVRRLKDGKLWMVENLRLGSTSDITLTPENSDVTEVFTLKGSDDIDFYDEYNQHINTAHADEIVENNYNNQKYGVYYNWCAATAGTCLNDRVVASSVCPKGWHLPTISEFEGLSKAYSGNYTDMINTSGRLIRTMAQPTVCTLTHTVSTP